MFTGIITHLATITQIITSGTNKDFWLSSTITGELKIDQSVAHNGVCLTVVAIREDQYCVTAVAETLQITTLDSWQEGDKINLELSLRVGDRLDGHFVQGHVDSVATCIEKQVLDGSWLFRFQYPATYAAMMIEKGSVCLNGVSLTAFEVVGATFMVTIIPYTYNHTNFHEIEVGSRVNIEFDVLGKYLQRQQNLLSTPVT